MKLHQRKSTFNRFASRALTRNAKRRAAARKGKAPNPLKADPTRTATLRRAFAAELKQRFDRLKIKVLKLVQDEDAFGLKGKNQVAPVRVANQWVPSTKIIEVEDIRQPDHFTCGAAATTAVNRYFRVGADSVAETAKILGTTVERSTHPDAIVAYERSLGLPVEARAGLTVDDLAAYTGRGWPVLVCVQDYMGRRDPHAEFNYGHYLTVIGVVSQSPRYVICQDSSLENWERVAGGDTPKAQVQEGNIDAPGRIMVREDDWLNVWHDVDVEGNKYIQFGIAIGLPEQTVNYNPDQPRDEQGRFGSGGGVAGAAHALTHAIAASATAFLDKLPGGAWLREQGARIKAGMVDRYGAKTAAAIILSGQAISWGAAGLGAAVGTPVWVPGVVAMAPAALLAEMHYQVKQFGGHVQGWAANMALLTPDEIEIQGGKLVTELTRLWRSHAGFEEVRNTATDQRMDWAVWGIRVSPLPEAPTANTRWAFDTDADAVEKFRDWLQQQLADDILNDSLDDLLQKYAEAGFRKGAGRAFDDVQQAKWGPHEGDFYAGTREQFLRDTFGQAVATEKVKLLATRTYTDLKGVTDQMATKMARELMDGLVEGKSPYDIGKDIASAVDDIGTIRATTIARTEIIRAHSEGQLEAMETLGVEELGVAVEWSTTEGACEQCAPLDGVVFKLEEAHNILPRHPNCRCCWIPAGVGEDAAGQKKTKGAITKAVGQSVKAEVGKDGDADDSSWAGADKTISKNRPRSVVNVWNYDGWVTLEGGQHVYLSGGKLHYDGPPATGPTKTSKGPKGAHGKPRGHEAKEHEGGKSHEEKQHRMGGGRGGGGRGGGGHGGGAGHSGASGGAGHQAKQGSSGHGGTAGPGAAHQAAKASAHGVSSRPGPASALAQQWEAEKAAIDAQLDQMQQEADEERQRQQDIEAGLAGNALLEFSAWLADNERSGGKFFARCARDARGHCEGEGNTVSAKELKQAQKQARAKAAAAPKPTKEEIAAANEKMDRIGADDYEMQIRGKSSDRAASRKKLLKEFGDGHTCPCCYCGLKLDDKTVTRDKIYTARQGGRYRHSNLIPACLACNKSRGDVPFEKIKWPKS